MLKQRILTALILLPIMLLMLLWANQAIWGLFCGLIALLALWEYGRIVGFSRTTQRSYLIGTAFFFITALMGDWALPAFVWLLALAFWLVVMPMWLHKKWIPQDVWANGVWLVIDAAILVWYVAASP